MSDENTGADQAAAPAKKAKAEVESVTMKDQRVVGFAGKKKMLKEVLVEGDQVSVRFDFRNGETVTFPVPSQHRLYAMGHGYSQKLGDSVAGETDVDDMYLGVRETGERLEGGDWAAVREGGGFGGTSVLLRALVEFSGKTAEEIRAFLKDKSQAQKMALRGSAKLKPIVDRMEAEKLAKGTANIDTDALLGGLGS